MSTFKYDKIVRNANQRPVGRVVLARPYVEGEAVYAALLVLLKTFTMNPLGEVIYIDETPYSVPSGISSTKVSSDVLSIMLNNVKLEPKESPK